MIREMQRGYTGPSIVQYFSDRVRQQYVLQRQYALTLGGESNLGKDAVT